MKMIIYFLQSIIIFLLFIIFRIIGYKNASNLGAFLGRIFGKLIKTDKIILKNLDIISKSTKENIENKNQVVSNVFSNYGRVLAEYVYLKNFRSGLLKDNINIIGSKYLEEIKLKNKRVVFISGHFNNFELMAMYIEASGINLCAIYRPLNNFFLNKIMEDIRINHICKNQIKKGKSGTRKLLEFLKKNYSVALMVDQRVTEGIKSNFFGRPASTTTIPAQIIKKYDCEIVPVYIERFDNIKFNLIINKPIKFNKELNTEIITLELNKIIEKMVLNNPSQWILTHNRWK